MAIIGVSGYAGSGKDTVGKMISVVSLWRSHGMSIEDSMKMYNENKWASFGSTPEWKIKKFGEKLKIIGALLLGVHVSEFESQEFKSSELSSEWDYYVGVHTGHDVFDINKVKMTVRDFMQKLGTDAMRNKLHQDVWVNALFSDYKKDPYGDFKYPNWVITDVRFINETKIIKKHQGIIIRVTRPGISPANLHASETELDDYKFDYYLDNSKDINYLSDQVKEILQHYPFI